MTTEVFAIGTTLLMGKTVLSIGLLDRVAVLSTGPIDGVTVLSTIPLDRVWGPGREDTRLELEYVTDVRVPMELIGICDDVTNTLELVSLEVFSGNEVEFEEIGNGADSDLIGFGESTGFVPDNEGMGGREGGVGISVGPRPVPMDVGGSTGFSDGNCDEEATMLSRSKIRLYP